MFRVHSSRGSSAYLHSLANLGIRNRAYVTPTKKHV